MSKINAAISADLVTEAGAHRFVAEASTLGWPPGFWPKQAATDLGNGEPLHLRWMNGESAIYSQAMGDVLVEVLND